MQTLVSRLWRFAWRLLKFCILGLPGAAIYNGLFFGLTEYVGLWYVASSAASFFIASGVNFLLHKFWMFGDSETTLIERQFKEYFGVRIFFHAGKTFCLLGLVEFLGLWYVHAQMILMLIPPIPTYLVSTLIFKKERAVPSPT